MLEIQLRSIIQYTDIQCLKEHIIIFNDVADMSDDIQNIVQSCSYLIPVNIIDGQTLLNAEHRALRGWITQQVLKLKVSEFVSSPVYFVLDAKNHLVGQYQMKALFAENKPLIYLQSSRGGWQNAIEGACDIFGIREDSIQQYSAPITPFPILTEIVNKMHDELAELGDSAEDIICRSASTEFLLYWVYLNAKNLTGHYEQVNFRNCPHKTLFRSFDFSNFEDLLLKNSPVGWVGIHLNHFTNENMSKIVNYWEKYNLTPHFCGVDSHTSMQE